MTFLVALCAVAAALCGPALAHGAYEFDTSYGEDGRFAQAVGEIGVGAVGAVAGDPRGRLLVAGDTLVDDQPALAVARIGPEGSRDRTFAGGEARFDLEARELTVVDATLLRTGALVIAVQRVRASDGARSDLLVAVTATGALDGTFGEDGVQPVGRLDGRDVLVTDAAGGLLVVEDRGEGRAVHRRTAAGAVDPAYGNGGVATHTTGRVGAIAVTSAGGLPTIVVGTADRGVGISRLTASGDADMSFAGGGAVEVGRDCGGVRVAVGSDGRVLAACGTTIVQLSPVGELDTGFDGDGSMSFEQSYGPVDVAYDSTLRPLLLVRADTGRTTHGRSEVRRLLPSGALDPGWAGDGSSPDDPGIRNDARLTVLSNDVVAMSGTYAAIGTERVAFTPPRVARFAVDGRLDPTFDEDGRTLVRLGGGPTVWTGGADATASGALRIAGYSHFGEEQHPFVLGVTNSGALDESWGEGGVAILEPAGAYVGGVQTLPDGDLLVSGHDDGPSRILWRLNPDGKPATDFGHDGIVRTPAPPGAVTAHGILLERTLDGGWLIAGTFETRAGARFVALGRLTAAYEVDGTFGEAGWTVLSGDRMGYEPRPRHLIPNADGTIDVITTGGHDTSWTLAIHRRRPDGRPDATFGTSGTVIADAVGGSPRSILTQGDDRLLVLVEPASRWRMELVALTREGRVDPTYGSAGRTEITLPSAAGEGRQPVVTAMRWDDAGRLLIAAGAYENYGCFCSRRAFVTRVLKDGRRDASFGQDGSVVGPPADGRTTGVPTAIVLQPDERMVLIGTAGTFHRKAAAFAFTEENKDEPRTEDEPGTEDDPATPSPESGDTRRDDGQSTRRDDGPAHTDSGAPPRGPNAMGSSRAVVRRPARLRITRAALRGRRLHVVATLGTRSRAPVRVVLRARGMVRSWTIRPRRRTAILRRRVPRALTAATRVTVVFAGDSRVAASRRTARLKRVRRR